MRPRIKICCISSKLEADQAIRAGANALGLVSHMPSGPGVISELEIAEIVPHIPKSIASFLLTSSVDTEEIVRQQQATGASCLQLVDAHKPSNYRILHGRLPDTSLVQVIHVLDGNSIDQAKEVAPFVDALLLDSGNPDLHIKELGGTGRVHNWDISRQIVSEVDIPVYLAGGISAENVGRAIRYVKPYGIDLCSSVRMNDKLDPVKLAAFFETVNNL